jgi:hypothetical protein
MKRKRYIYPERENGGFNALGRERGRERERARKAASRVGLEAMSSLEAQLKARRGKPRGSFSKQLSEILKLLLEIIFGMKRPGPFSEFLRSMRIPPKSVLATGFVKQLELPRVR